MDDWQPTGSSYKLSKRGALKRKGQKKSLTFLETCDPRPLTTQVHNFYSHGGILMSLICGQLAAHWEFIQVVKKGSTQKEGSEKVIDIFGNL